MLYTYQQCAGEAELHYSMNSWSQCKLSSLLLFQRQFFKCLFNLGTAKQKVLPVWNLCIALYQFKPLPSLAHFVSCKNKVHVMKTLTIPYLFLCTGAELYFSSVQPIDAGIYICTCQDQRGSNRSHAEIIVAGATLIWTICSSFN